MNVIFDLGGVIVTWNPDRIVESVVEDPSRRNTIRAAVFDHPDWLELDRGTLDPSVAIERAAARAGASISEIDLLMRELPRSLVPIPESLDLVQDVKASGHLTFALSNMHVSSITHLEREHSLLDLFDGAVISCRIGLMKPEPEIFEHLLAEYELDPAETVFFDDTEVNLVTARSLGIMAVMFESATQARRELEAMGVL